MYSLLEVCFMCLKNKNDLKIFFKKDDDEQISEHVKYIFPELVIPESESPLRICTECEKNVLSFRNFKLMCYENICRLKSSINNTENLPVINPANRFADEIKEIDDLINEINDIDKELDALEAEESSDDTDEEFQDSESDEEPSIKKIKTEIGEPADPLSLPENLQPVELVEIKTELLSDDEDREIYKNVKQELNLLPEDETTGNSDKQKQLRYKCSHCARSYQNFQFYKKHMKSHGEIKENRCLTCDQVFKTEKELKKHRIIHVETFPCTICNKTFRQKFTLKLHMHVHNVSKQ